MKELKLCQHCKWAKPDKDSSWENRCYHPFVIATDAFALGGNYPDDKRGYGVNCRYEREKGFFSGKCGMRGALWEARP